MRDIDGICEVVRETLEDEASDLVIEGIEVNRDVDSHGDQVLMIDIVFRGDPAELDATTLSSLVRFLRPRLLSRLDESAFPLLSFVSSAEAHSRSIGTS